MKLLLNILAVVVLLVGIVFILQGSNVLGGSPMSGQSQWTIVGIIAAVVGIIALWRINARRRYRPGIRP